MLLLASLLAAMPAPAAPCPARVAAAGPFVGWEQSRPVAAAHDYAAARDATIVVGKAALVTLRPATELRFAVPPEKAVQPATNAGIVAFTAPAAGRYRIGAGAGVWLDVTEGSRGIASITHTHGPACGPVRKIVDFQLSAGRHLLQISGATQPAVVVMVAKAD